MITQGQQMSCINLPAVRIRDAAETRATLEENPMNGALGWICLWVCIMLSWWAAHRAAGCCGPVCTTWTRTAVQTPQLRDQVHPQASPSMPTCHEPQCHICSSSWTSPLKTFTENPSLNILLPALKPNWPRKQHTAWWNKSSCLRRWL